MVRSGAAQHPSAAHGRPNELCNHRSNREGRDAGDAEAHGRDRAVANIGFGLLLAAITLTIAPEINLFERPWMAPSHLLRAAVWVNILLGAVNLLPASPLDGGRVFRGEFAKTKGVIKGSRAAAGLGQFIAIGLIVAGLLVPNMWLVMIGAFLMIGSHMEDQGLLLQTDVDAVRMRDVMLTQFSMLSASDTLEDALQRSVHTLQDVFPVVRGANLVVRSLGKASSKPCRVTATVTCRA